VVECGVGLGIVLEKTARRVGKTMALAIVPLEEPWAARDLTICVRALKELPPYARELVGHLRAPPLPDGRGRVGAGAPTG
jgi:DNA-binding transcriptional LysR family regulator